MNGAGSVSTGSAPFVSAIEPFFCACGTRPPPVCTVKRSPATDFAAAGDASEIRSTRDCGVTSYDRETPGATPAYVTVSPLAFGAGTCVPARPTPPQPCPGRSNRTSCDDDDPKYDW